MESGIIMAMLLPYFVTLHTGYLRLLSVPCSFYTGLNTINP